MPFREMYLGCHNKVGPNRLCGNISPQLCKWNWDVPMTNERDQIPSDEIL